MVSRGVSERGVLRHMVIVVVRIFRAANATLCGVGYIWGRRLTVCGTCCPVIVLKPVAGGSVFLSRQMLGISSVPTQL